MSNFSKQRRLCKLCKQTWFIPLFRNHKTCCVIDTPVTWPASDLLIPSDKRRLLKKVMEKTS